MSKDLYETLGVSKNATQDEIKKAYRKLAHLHHPDKAGVSSDTKFKEINEAYQVLSDPQKRSQYDQFGSVGGSGGGNWQDSNSGFGGAQWSGENPFGGFGGINDIFETMFGQAFSQVQTEIAISLTTAMLGEKLELQTSTGESITLNIPPGTADGTTFRFKGYGQTYKRGRGDLLVTVRVKLPRKLNREQKELFEKLRQTGM